MTHELKPRILVFGVGGAGGNAVDNMIEANLQGVEFIVANTDAQALSRSKTENRIQLGPETTRKPPKNPWMRSASASRAPTWSSSPRAWAAEPEPAQPR